MRFDKIKTLLAVIGFVTLLYMFGSWSIEIIQNIIAWIQSTGVAKTP